jgi:hypothetical protein
MDHGSPFASAALRPVDARQLKGLSCVKILVCEFGDPYIEFIVMVAQCR